MSSSSLFAKAPPAVSRLRLFAAIVLAIAACGLLFSVTEPSIRVNQPFKVESLFAVCLAGYLFFSYRSRAGLLSSTSQLSGIVAAGVCGFAAWSGASALWATTDAGVAHHTLVWALYLIVFLIFSNTIARDANTDFAIAVVCGIALILGVVCVVDYLTTTDLAISEGPIRVRYNKYAELLVTIVPLLCAAAVASTGRFRRIVLFTATALGWLTVMLSLSKGAFIAGILGFLFFFAAALLFSGAGPRRQLALAAVAWLALTVGTQAISSAVSPLPATTQYITGSADPTRDTTAMRLFTWQIARQMWSDHLIVGVGADNFGVAVNEARRVHRLDHPDDPGNEIAEDYLIERAHNEPLQILAELGVIGMLLFSLPFLAFGFYLFRYLRKNYQSAPPLLWASLAGMAAFAVSSLFSSFSFRSVQNGAVFFVVMAVAVSLISDEKADNGVKKRFQTASLRYALAWLVALALAAFCVSRIGAEYHGYRAEQAATFDEADDHFQSAVGFDREYAGAYLSHAYRAAQEYQHERSAALFGLAVKNGIGTSPTYAAFAKQQSLAGDINGAEATFREAVATYPRSPFIRIAFAIFLDDIGKRADAALQRAEAAKVSERQAKGWDELMRNGSMTALARSKSDNSVAPPAELKPDSAVRQFLDKTDFTK